MQFKINGQQREFLLLSLGRWKLSKLSSLDWVGSQEMCDLWSLCVSCERELCLALPPLRFVGGKYAAISSTTRRQVTGKRAFPSATILLLFFPGCILVRRARPSNFASGLEDRGGRWEEEEEKNARNNGERWHNNNDNDALRGVARWRLHNNNGLKRKL